MAKNQLNDDFLINVDNNESSSNTNQVKGDEKMKKLKEHVNEVSNIMQENIEKILERGSRLDHLEDRSEMLSSRADEFRVSSRRVSRKMWWQNMKFNIIIALVIVIVLAIIFWNIKN